MSCKNTTCKKKLSELYYVFSQMILGQHVIKYEFEGETAEYRNPSKIDILREIAKLERLCPEAIDPVLSPSTRKPAAYRVCITDTDCGGGNKCR